MRSNKISAGKGKGKGKGRGSEERNGNLVYDATILHHSLGPDKDQVDLLHDVPDSRIQDQNHWDADFGEGVHSPVPTLGRARLCHIHHEALVLLCGLQEDPHHQPGIGVGEDDRPIPDEVRSELGNLLFALDCGGEKALSPLNQSLLAVLKGLERRRKKKKEEERGREGERERERE